MEITLKNWAKERGFADDKCMAQCLPPRIHYKIQRSSKKIYLKYVAKMGFYQSVLASYFRTPDNQIRNH